MLVRASPKGYAQPAPEIVLRCLAFIVISPRVSKTNRAAAGNHEAVVGFYRPT
jgi:hypothetical protein